MNGFTTHRASLSLLQLELPGTPPVHAGVLLLDPVGNKLYVRMRRDWDQIAPEEADVLELVEHDLAAKAEEFGAITRSSAALSVGESTSIMRPSTVSGSENV